MVHGSTPEDPETPSEPQVSILGPVAVSHLVIHGIYRPMIHFSQI
jgi:hypothetical protein